VLGYLNPDFFAGGSLALDPDLAFRAVESVSPSRWAYRSRPPRSASTAWSMPRCGSGQAGVDQTAASIRVSSASALAAAARCTRPRWPATSLLRA